MNVFNAPPGVSNHESWSSDFTSVDRHTPSGRKLRKYWHPILLSAELPRGSKKRLLLLGESIVLFRLHDGTLAAVPTHCPHRGASLEYGYIESDGIRCAYHGWKLGMDGRLLECPFGGPDPMPDRQQVSVVEMRGIIFVMLGNEEDHFSPPKWDLLEETGLELVVQRHEVQCNWFQYQENAADPVHTLFTHAARYRSLGVPESSGFFGQLVWYAFAVHGFGLVKGWLYEGRGAGWGNLAIFPNILRIPGEMHWRVPLTNDRTLVFQLALREQGSGLNHVRDQIDRSHLLHEAIAIESPPVYQDGIQTPTYSTWSFQGQDAAACASQGVRVNRGYESLCPSDQGIILYRDAWAEACACSDGSLETYRAFCRRDGIIDCRPYLGRREAAASRPLDIPTSESSASYEWGDVFGEASRMITVPRGSAGRGPLG